MFFSRSLIRFGITILCLNGWFNVVLAQDHECTRTCVSGEDPLECVYTFTVEEYYAMSKACYSCPDTSDDCNREDCVPADGRQRPITVVNRQLPGPSIEVCLGDEIIVQVDNAMPSEATTIHWHGFHQEGTQYMDGVPLVTQCNIPPITSFTYKFTADKPGTHFWHSHSGLQRADGLFGRIVVREPTDSDVHSDLYDYDLSSHVIILIDWDEETSSRKYLSHYHSSGGNQPTNLLINGRGRYDGDDSTVTIPYQRFYVDQGYRYRFRIINAGALNCPVQVFIDDHPLTVISTDGNDVIPVEAESLTLSAGERFDFIITANQTEGAYWMKFKGLQDCATNSVFQLGVLQYSEVSDSDPESTPTYDDLETSGLQVNGINLGIEDTESNIPLPLLTSVESMNESLALEPDFTYLISYDVYFMDNPMYHKENVYGVYNVSQDLRVPLPQINHITMSMLSFPLLSGRSNIESDMLCNETTISSDCEEVFCSCTHVVQIPLGNVVEFIIVDKNALTNHPIHLHGFTFSVVGMERLEGEVTDELIWDLYQNGSLYRNFDNPAVKDTVGVPGGGYTIVRFIASNPGYWFLHCHLEFHAEDGMGLVFKVGEDSDMPDVPENFPTCGDYVPA